MSRFFSSALSHLSPYTPGEQPLTSYIKLNTNESPFPPAAHAELSLQLYPDPECRALREAFSKELGVSLSNLIFTNGSDEALAFIFLSLCERGAAFPDLTYGFYSVYADLFRVPKKIIPLREDFTLALSDYAGLSETLFIANPNAPTGLAHTCAELEALIAENPGRLVVVDEAYVDFGGESAVPLIARYDNLLVVGTFSKSRSLAGARLGYAVGNCELIADLYRVKFSFNPYSVNRAALEAGLAAVRNRAYFEENCAAVQKTRAALTAALRAQGFRVLESLANFVFASPPDGDGRRYYEALRARGVLVRYFDSERCRPFVRITVGSDDQIDALIRATKEYLK